MVGIILRSRAGLKLTALIQSHKRFATHSSQQRCLLFFANRSKFQESRCFRRISYVKSISAALLDSSVLIDSKNVCPSFYRSFIATVDSYTVKNYWKESASNMMMNNAPRSTPLLMNLSTYNQFRELLTPELELLITAFIKNGHEIRIIGGAVRDIILSRHLPKDIDLATTATPDEMMHVFKTNKIRYIETGLQHGTLTAHLNGHDFEITTLRIDTEHDGRRATVEFTNDWKVDAERRDLTINAMSLDFDGNLYDYFNGYDDLKAKKVQFVGNPEKRIREDYLRILRYFRFHGRIADDAAVHEQKTLDIIKKCSPGLSNVAKERIWVEVSRILTVNHAPSLLKIMYELDVAQHIGLPPCTTKHLEDFEFVWKQCHPHFLEPVTILMSLVDTVDEADSLSFSLKLSSAERNLGKFVVHHRNIEHSDDPQKPYKDILASCSNSKLTDKVRKHVDQVLRYRGLHGMAEEIEQWQVPMFPVTGNDLKMNGVKPGPLLGKILHEMKEMWLESYYTMSKEELLEKLEHIMTKFHT
eukprot:gene3598-4105_t